MPALAANITIANTGQAAPTAADPSWLVNGSTAFVTDQSGFPFPIWLAPGGASDWISPQPSYTSGQSDSPGVYDYSTTFDLTGLDPSTASLTFLVAVDDSLTDVLINGASTGLTHDSLSSFSSPLAINAGFIAGLNNIVFRVSNTAGPPLNPSGLRVEFTSATADEVAVPEPTSIALFGMGIALLAVRRYRRQS